MELSTIELAGSEALMRLELLRKEFRIGGPYPFLMGDAEDLERLTEAEEMHKDSTDDIIRLSFSSDGGQLLQIRQQQIREFYSAHGGLELNEDGLLGVWEGESTQKGSIHLHKDILTGMNKDLVYIALVAVDEPWKVPAVTKYGGWNDCPRPYVHCSIMRYWHKKWGAEIVGMSGDIIECTVSRPPVSEASAIDLAWEQYWYCSDIVDQGTQSICKLASTLINSNYWFFWWD